MKLIDNMNSILGGDLKVALRPKARLKTELEALRA